MREIPPTRAVLSTESDTSFKTRAPIGSCTVRETSIILAVSFSHRKAVSGACSWIVGEAKRRARYLNGSTTMDFQMTIRCGKKI